MQIWKPPNTEFPPPKPSEPQLHAAARLGDSTAIRRLASEGADLNAVFDMALDPGGRPRPATPLMVAAGSGDGASAETVKILLDLGADPKLTAGENSAATYACAGLGWNYKPGGDAERLRLVLAAGSPLPTNAEVSNRLLCDTAASGDAERLSVLLSYGLNARGHFDPERARERHRAMMKNMAEFQAGQPDIFAGMPAEIRASMAESMKETETRMAEQQASGPSHFEIPLFRAAESGAVECLWLLLDAGADPKARDNSKRTAMYYANSPEVVRALMAAGLPLEDADEFEWSPLCSAMSDGADALPRVKALVEAGADVNATHDRGYTIFMTAVGSNRYPELLRFLVGAGADPHAVTEIGYNAFHAAIDVNGEANAEESVRDTLRYLRELGVDVEHRNKYGQTPLARAIQEGTGTEVRALCEFGANPNASCPKRQCGGDACSRIDLPLLFHAADGTGVHKDVKTEALLKAVADPLVKDDTDCSPLECAVASLCQDSADYENSFVSFFAGLRELQFGDMPRPTTQDEFVARVSPTLRQFVERFASNIPTPDDSEYGAKSRAETLACAVLLSAYERWIAFCQSQ